MTLSLPFSQQPTSYTDLELEEVVLMDGFTLMDAMSVFEVCGELHILTPHPKLFVLG